METARRASRCSRSSSRDAAKCGLRVLEQPRRNGCRWLNHGGGGDAAQGQQLYGHAAAERRWRRRRGAGRRRRQRTFPSVVDPSNAPRIGLVRLRERSRSDRASFAATCSQSSCSQFDARAAWRMTRTPSLLAASCGSTRPLASGREPRGRVYTRTVGVDFAAPRRPRRLLADGGRRVLRRLRSRCYLDATESRASTADLRLVEAAAVARAAAGEGASQVVLGMPYNPSGGEGEQASVTRALVSHKPPMRSHSAASLPVDAAVFLRGGHPNA